MINVSKSTILFIFICVSLLLSSCSDNAFKFKNDGDTGNLIDEKNGRYYIYCKGYLLAKAIKPDIYAKGDGGEKLYEVSGLDPAEWLSEDISNSKIIPFLFREQSVEEPKLEEFETKIIHIVELGEAVIAAGSIKDKEDIDTIVNEFLYNEETDAPDFVTDKFEFYFESDKYSGIYYVLTYLVDERNNAYLYDRWTGQTGRCVSCSYKLFGGSGIGNGINLDDLYE